MERIARTIRWVLRQLAFGYLRLQVTGLEHIPKQGGALIAGNHPNVMDGVLLLVASPRPIRFLVAEELYFHRYLHAFFQAFGAIPVYRTKSHNGEALRGAVEALERGEVIGIFPEGTTNYRGSMEVARKGVALLALKTGVPVVPLAIRGSYEAYRPGTTVPKPWPVFMRFEAPVSYQKAATDPIPEEQVGQTLEDLRQRVLGAMTRMSHEWVNPHTKGLCPGLFGVGVKRLRIVVSALIVVPLTSFLTLTANPSLDPVEPRG